MRMTAPGATSLIAPSLIERARVFAMAAHEAAAQTRKYTNEPYWVHPQAVARLVENVPGRSAFAVAAAHLHDVLEDTSVRLVTLRAEFGAEVFDLVRWVSKDVSTGGLPRAERLAHYTAKLATAPAEAKTIKLADIVDNCATIVERAPEFAAKYLREKQVMLAALRGGDPELWRSADEIIRRGLGA
jgi:(p)ppGpp synthase/HD superfamily hydrolase